MVTGAWVIHEWEFNERRPNINSEVFYYGHGDVMFICFFDC